MTTELTKAAQQAHTPEHIAGVDHAHELLRRQGYHRDGDYFINVNRRGAEAIHVLTISLIVHAGQLCALTQRPAAQEVRSVKVRITDDPDVAKILRPAAQTDEQTVVEICERIGFGRVQQIAGHAWEQKHHCAPRGRMGVTVRNETPAPQQATPEPVGEPVAWWKRHRDGSIEVNEAKTFLAEDALSTGRRPLVFGDTRPAPGVPDAEDLRDRLVAISSAVADSDDRAAQSMLSETLRLLAAAAQSRGGCDGT